MFWVTRPRFEVRFLNRPVDSSGSLPARSRARMWRKNQTRKAAPATSSTAISAGLLSAWRIPKTTKNMPTADRTAPNASKGRVGSAGSGSLDPAAEQDDQRDDQRLEDERGAPADRGRDQTADQRPGRGADAAQPADDAERPGARGQVAEAQRREDVDRRDQQRGADALEHRVAEDQHARARARPR